MSNARLIARLDIKGENLIKGIQLEGLRVIGDPKVYAQSYYNQGVDELIYMDSVASLYGRNNLSSIVRYTAENIFVPLTVGGGVRSLDDVSELLNAGADKIAINTAAVNNPRLITDIAQRYGSQCVVLSIEAKLRSKGEWEAYIDNGRERTGLDAISWAKIGQELGAGELLVTSVDKEGGRKGMDYDLIKAVCDVVNIPVIASGGVGEANDVVRAIKNSKADAVAIASILHYNTHSLLEIRNAALKADLHVRMI